MAHTKKLAQLRNDLTKSKDEVKDLKMKNSQLMMDFQNLHLSIPIKINKAIKAYEIQFAKSYQPLIEYKALSIQLQKDFDQAVIEKDDFSTKYETILVENKQMKTNVEKLKAQILELEFTNHKQMMSIQNLRKFKSNHKTKATKEEESKRSKTTISKKSRPFNQVVNTSICSKDK